MCNGDIKRSEQSAAAKRRIRKKPGRSMSVGMSWLNGARENGHATWYSEDPGRESRRRTRRYSQGPSGKSHAGVRSGPHVSRWQSRDDAQERIWETRLGRLPLEPRQNDSIGVWWESVSPGNGASGARGPRPLAVSHADC